MYISVLHQQDFTRLFTHIRTSERSSSWDTRHFLGTLRPIPSQGNEAAGATQSQECQKCQGGPGSPRAWLAALPSAKNPKLERQLALRKTCCTGEKEKPASRTALRPASSSSVDVAFLRKTQYPSNPTGTKKSPHSAQIIQTA